MPAPRSPLSFLPFSIPVPGSLFTSFPSILDWPGYAATISRRVPGEVATVSRAASRRYNQGLVRIPADAADRAVAL